MSSPSPSPQQAIELHPRLHLYAIFDMDNRVGRSAADRGILSAWVQFLFLIFSTAARWEEQYQKLDPREPNLLPIFLTNPRISQARAHASP